MIKNDDYILRNVPWAKDPEIKQIELKKYLDLEKSLPLDGMSGIMKIIYNDIYNILDKIYDIIEEQLALINLTMDDVEGIVWQNMDKLEETYEIYHADSYNQGCPRPEPLIIITKPFGFALPVLVKGVNDDT